MCIWSNVSKNWSVLRGLHLYSFGVGYSYREIIAGKGVNVVLNHNNMGNPAFLDTSELSIVNIGGFTVPLAWFEK